jgi:hypothetical protein
MLQTAYGDEALNHSSVCEWFKWFKDGRPSTSRNADIIENVHEIVTWDHRLTIRMMLDELNINKEMIHQIFHDLWKRKIYTKFVPQSHEWAEATRLTSCQDFIHTCQDNASFVACTVTRDESWVFQYDQETKCQSMQWTLKSSPRPKKFRLQNFKIKTMLITFFDKQGVIH